MKKPLPLTGSTPDLSHDPVRDRFLASLQRQLQKVAHTHPSPYTRALFQWMHDGRQGPAPTIERKPVPAPEPIPAPAPVAKAPEPRRAPPARPAFKRPTALAK